jgi:hypothetical protein
LYVVQYNGYKKKKKELQNYLKRSKVSNCYR